MSTNNYFGFTHGGTQYGAAATGPTYPAAQQSGYAVAPTPTATYSAQRTGYDQAAYQAAAQGTYAGAGTPSVTYDYGYGRTYDTTKTYYQQTPSTATYQAAAQPYADAATQPPTKVTGYQTAQYVAGPTRNNVPQQQPKAVVAPASYNTNQTYAPQTAYQQNPQANAQPKQPPATTTSSNYSSYDAALYSAATMYAVQQSKPNNGPNPGWQGFKKGNMKAQRPKPQPKPQQLHYCEVCKISCAGPQTYREHLEGQKHKRREASLKMAATAVQTSQNRGNNLHCELCGVTCTGNDAYAAHVRGSKHQKVVKLHQKLGKPIPTVDPNFKKPVKVNFVPAGGEGAAQPADANVAATATPANIPTQAANIAADAPVTNVAKVDLMEEDISSALPEDDIKPVGNEYIEEIKGDDGKMIKFNCKLCECGFNDPNAKEMHMKGRRHRLQYKRKVQPDLIVDLKPTPRQKRIAEAKAQRAAMQADFWNRQRNLGDDNNDDGMYWEERRRGFDNEFDNMPYNIPWNRGFPPGARPAPPFIRAPMPFGFGMMGPPGRARPESFDDRHVVAKHAEIYPKEEELQLIQRIVSHTERALKFVSDALTDKSAQQQQTVTNGVNKTETAPATVENKSENTEDSATKSNENDAANNATAEKEAKPKEDGRDNQLFSFQKETEGSSVRLLKGVMRVGLLAKGLLLQGDKIVQLVVLCAEKPTVSLLKRVAAELPVQLKLISEEHQFTVTMEPEESAVLVSDDTITVKVFLTSPLLRDPQQDSNIAATATEQTVPNPDDLLPRDPCLQALAALRHAKWFQARATGLQSCVMIIRVLRDLCQRIPTWTPLSQWALELLTEKIIASAGMPLSPGDCMRRVMEALSTGLLINGPGLLDPCEKEPHDALVGLSKQQREDLTVSAQNFLRMIAFRQVYKVLGIELLPPQKFAVRQWRFGRKRRRSGTEGADSEGDSKIVKKDAENTSMETAPTEPSATATPAPAEAGANEN
ncbi:zinc finger RNA-binding protein isoform X2 [Sitodiplosis mosellana]|uniref:zinc finger RNA-binding protein isoform X2 n=1 Tax=Sitodiplosis mosellana TaxID=263140 RepID=UPI002444E552|nr:zinc finger RNA-binding protein isoform X2 [Sitodiplosis mosellana]